MCVREREKKKQKKEKEGIVFFYPFYLSNAHTQWNFVFTFVFIYSLFLKVQEILPFISILVIDFKSINVITKSNSNLINGFF